MYVKEMSLEFSLVCPKNFGLNPQFCSYVL